MIALHIQTKFPLLYKELRDRLLEAPEVDVGEWHSQQTKGQDHLISRELRNLIFIMDVPDTQEKLASLVVPNLPWAENHFQERVSGKPWNPPPSASEWPYAQEGHDKHTDSVGKFSHTYPERYWPREAGLGHPAWKVGPNIGIRFEYGDLYDVVQQLRRNPLTRQAYLPVWFPEDTGAVHGERVPCSLGYHFLIRNNVLEMTYMIRSCDFVRHFADDVYMSARLMQWMQEKLYRSDPEDVPFGYLELGRLTMHTMSMHIFNGDVPKLMREAGRV